MKNGKKKLPVLVFVLIVLFTCIAGAEDGAVPVRRAASDPHRKENGEGTQGKRASKSSCGCGIHRGCPEHDRVSGYDGICMQILFRKGSICCFRCQDDPCADHSCGQHLSQRRLLRQNHYLHPDPGQESRIPSSAGKEQHSVCRFRHHAFRSEPALGSESQAVI